MKSIKKGDKIIYIQGGRRTKTVVKERCNIIKAEVIDVIKTRESAFKKIKKHFRNPEIKPYHTDKAVRGERFLVKRTSGNFGLVLASNAYLVKG